MDRDSVAPGGIVRKRLSPRGHHSGLPDLRGIPQERGGRSLLAWAVDGAGIGREREGEVVVSAAGVLTHHGAAGCEVGAGGLQVAGESAERGIGVVEPQVPLLARIKQRRRDGHSVAQQRLDGESIEAALQLLAAIEDDVVPGRAAGLIVAHQGAAVVDRDIQPVDVSP